MRYIEALSARRAPKVYALAHARALIRPGSGRAAPRVLAHVVL